MPLSDEKIVSLIKSGATPHDIATIYGVPLTRSKSLFPHGNFDTFKATCMTMFYRGQSSMEIGSALKCNPLLVTKALSLTFTEEKMLHALLSAADNGYTTTQISKAFNVKRSDVADTLREFGRFSDMPEHFSWFKAAAARINVDKWKENVYNLFVDEKWEESEVAISAKIEKEYREKAEALFKKKLGIDIDDETDEQYITRTMSVLQDGTGLSKAAITRHAIHSLGNRLGIKNSGRTREEARKVLIDFNLDVKNIRESAHAGMLDEAEDNQPMIIRRTRVTAKDQHGIPEHLRGVSLG